MWQGLTAKHANRAASASLGRIMAFPWVALALVYLVVVLDSLRGRREPDLGWKFFLGLWLTAGLVTDFGFGAFARRKLLTEFRRAAEQRFTPSAGFWARLFGPGQTGGVPPPVLLERE